MAALLSFWFIKPKHRKALRFKKKKKLKMEESMKKVYKIIEELL